MYYLLLDGAQSGPYSLAQLIDMWGARRINALTLYWEDGNADWLPLHNIAPLLEIPTPSARPPVLPPAEANKATMSATPAATSPAVEESVLWSEHPTLWYWLGELIWGVILSPILIGIPILIHAIWSRNTTRYQVTTRRVSVRTGLFTRTSRELRIVDIRSIAARSNVFGIGTIEFSTAARADAEVAFLGLSHVERVRDLVTQLQNGQVF